METDFIFSKYEFIDTTLKLYYNTNNYEFVEEIDFHKTPKKETTPILNLAFQYLHLVCGISYYKTFLPKNIIIKTCKLDKEQADFFNTLYFNGLGEFSYKNKIKLDINFPIEKEKTENNVSFIALSDKILLPIGGGKDSLVAFSLLKDEMKKIYTFSINTAKPIKDCCNFIGDKYGVENITVTRKISNTLLELVKNGIGYNGHIPISAIIAFISVCAGIVYDCNRTAIANEKSANVGNIEWQGNLINHQWSKSETAEIMIRNFIKKYIIEDFT
ncbi:MAG: hypothetical protein LBC92_00295 [Rickettsiales bacterium]|jgi:hypothetical protein|nr:hypothetical protein [Rickettsiales bacterium]